jgi:cytochrome c oxidase cbb3-type subunit 2
MDPAPRDFRRAVYHYRSTPSGSLPRDGDLYRTIALGLPGTEMAAWRDHLSPREIQDVIAYIKGFSPRFAEEEIDSSIVIPERMASGPQSVALGKAAYEKVQCGKCHGSVGRGDGWAQEAEMKDDRGHVVRARDFTKGIYRSGVRKADLYRTLRTGLDGTPMPSYEQTLSAEETANLVDYILSLERARGAWYWLSTPPRWYEPRETRVDR